MTKILFVPFGGFVQWIICCSGAAADAEPVWELHPLGGPEQGRLQDCRLGQGGRSLGQEKGEESVQGQSYCSLNREGDHVVVLLEL